MLLQDAFELYLSNNDCQRSVVNTVYIELRRGKIDTLQDLEELYNNDPQKLLKIRGIGPKSLDIIKDILIYCHK